MTGAASLLDEPIRTAAAAELSTRDIPLFGRDQEQQLLRRLLLRPRGRRGVMIAGPAGVGKTRLLEEAVAQLPRDTSIRYPAEFDVSWVRRLSGPGQRPAGRQALVIDDAHLLDSDQSAAVLELARRGGTVLLLAADLDRDTVPAEVTALWKDDHVARIDLSPLDGEAIRELAEAMLKGRICEATAAQFAALCEGYPLTLRELLRSSVQMGCLVDANGLWTLTRSPAVAVTGAGTCRRSLDALSAAARDVAELLAITGGLPAATVECLADTADIAAVDARGFLRLDRVGAPTHGDGLVRISRTVLQDLLRQQISPLRRRSLLRRLVRTLETAGRDRLDTTRWRHALGDPV
ncbi:AAA family ATPase, partial [Actinocorallia lasiicapitis]